MGVPPLAEEELFKAEITVCRALVLPEHSFPDRTIAEEKPGNQLHASSSLRVVGTPTELDLSHEHHLLQLVQPALCSSEPHLLSFFHKKGPDITNIL